MEIVKISESIVEPINMDVDEELDEEILRMSADDLRSRTQLLDNEIRIMRSEIQRINHNVLTLKEKIKENNERIKVLKKNKKIVFFDLNFFFSLYIILYFLDKQNTSISCF